MCNRSTTEYYVNVTNYEGPCGRQTKDFHPGEYCSSPMSHQTLSWHKLTLHNQVTIRQTVTLTKCIFKMEQESWKHCWKCDTATPKPRKPWHAWVYYMLWRLDTQRTDVWKRKIFKSVGIKCTKEKNEEERKDVHHVIKTSPVRIKVGPHRLSLNIISVEYQLSFPGWK